MPKEITPNTQENIEASEVSTDVSVGGSVTQGEASSGTAADSPTDLLPEGGAAAAGPGPAVESSFPDSTSFGWDSWDGAVDSLPEQVRGWGTSILDHNSKGWKAQLADAQTMGKIYEEMMHGNEDPRISEFSGKLAEGQTKFDELQAKFTAQESEYKESMAQMDAWRESEATKWAERFQRNHPEIAQDKEKVGLLIELLGEDFDDDIAVELLSLGSEAIKIARTARGAGTPAKYAYQLAKHHSTPVKPKPSPASLAMGGTGGGASRHTDLKEIEPAVSGSTQDRMRQIVARSWRKSQQKRRR